MTTINRNWASQSQIIGTGDGYVTLSGTTESYSSDVDMETNGYEGAHVTVEIDYDTTPTDEVKIKVYGSLDGSNYDDTPIWEMQGDKSVDPAKLSFQFRLFQGAGLGFNEDGVGVLQCVHGTAHSAIDGSWVLRDVTVEVILNNPPRLPEDVEPVDFLAGGVIAGEVPVAPIASGCP